MKRSDQDIEALFGRQFALETMVTQLVWAWARQQPHPPTALADYLRPLEEGMKKMAEAAETRGPAMDAARATVQEIALELEQTLQRAALLRAEPQDRAQ